MKRMRTIEGVKSLVGKVFVRCGKQREVTRVENLMISKYDNKTVLGDIYWRTPGGNERKKPTPTTTFRAWLHFAEQVD